MFQVKPGFKPSFTPVEATDSVSKKTHKNLR